MRYGVRARVLLAVACPVLVAFAGGSSTVDSDRTVVQKTAVSDAIVTWENETGIKVAAAARLEVESAFESPELEKELVRLPEKSRADLLAAGVAEYLGDVREQAGRTLVDSKSLEFLPPKRRAADFAQKLAGGPVGRLVVTSRPQNANIAIDLKPKGLTDKTFVVSTGKHAVTVEGSSANLSCSGDVSVAEGATARYCCPEPCGP